MVNLHRKIFNEHLEKGVLLSNKWGVPQFAKKKRFMLKLQNNNGRTELFDPIRKRWVLFTEEEKVRQYFIHELINKKIPASHISIEKQIVINGMDKRYDILVFNKDGTPWIVVECKAPHIKLTQDVVEQVARYNKILNAEIVGVTNGAEHHFFKIDYNTDTIHPFDFTGLKLPYHPNL